MMYFGTTQILLLWLLSTFCSDYVAAKTPSYVITAPGVIRPSHPYKVYATILRLEDGPVTLLTSIHIKDTQVQLFNSTTQFDQAGSKMIEMSIPWKGYRDNYQLEVEGRAVSSGAQVFSNTKDINFDSKIVSIFIELSRAIYRQGQTVDFRLIPVWPDLMPANTALIVHVKDPTGNTVRRWLGLRTDAAGGIVSVSFILSDQPNFGTWSIEVEGFGSTYKKNFQVEEYSEEKFDISIIAPPYVMDNVDSLKGTLIASLTRGRAMTGSAAVTLTLIPPNRKNGGSASLPQLSKIYETFGGKTDYEFSRDEMLTQAQDIQPGITSLIDFQCMINASVTDVFLNMTAEGFTTSSILYSGVKLAWIGDHVRTFKPDSVMTVYIAVMNYDGSPVLSEETDTVLLIVRKVSDAGTEGINQFDGLSPVDGVIQFDIQIGTNISSIELRALVNQDPATAIDLKATRYYSPNQRYISITTSTSHPEVNGSIVFHVKTSHDVDMVLYQVVAKGKIALGGELEMLSRQKTFTLTLAREMSPVAHIVVFYLEADEIVVDTLYFFVRGALENEVTAEVTNGNEKHSKEINVHSTRGSNVAVSATPEEQYSRGLHARLTEIDVIEDIASYDRISAARQLWRKSQSVNEFQYFPSAGFGIDADSTFSDAGLIVLTDAILTNRPNSCDTASGERPCFDGTSCYNIMQRCDRRFDCLDNWADEQGCDNDDDELPATSNQFNRNLRFYEDSIWASQKGVVNANGDAAFQVTPSKSPVTWIISGVSMSSEAGLGLMHTPVMLDATRAMYITVESPDIVTRGEQFGVRVTVFNNWYMDDYLEVLLTMEGGGDEYSYVLVEDEGQTSSYAPNTTDKDHHTTVFLEAGSTREIYLPIVPRIIRGDISFTVAASSAIGNDTVTRQVKVLPDGIENYYYTPFLIDLFRHGSLIVPSFLIPVSELYRTPEEREHLYVPGSQAAHLSLFGGAAFPTFPKDYVTCEGILRKPSGSAETALFTFAYNRLLLFYRRAVGQLPQEPRDRTLRQLSTELQKILTFMNPDGSFRMFREDSANSSSIWLTAFALKTLGEARYGEWKQNLFINIELLNKIAQFLCAQQNTSGAWYPEGPIYDRKYISMTDKDYEMYAHPIPLTAFVLIAMSRARRETFGDAYVCVENSIRLAREYLTKEVTNIPVGDVFQLAITSYALVDGGRINRDAFDKLWPLRRTQDGIYFSDTEIPSNEAEFINNIRYLLPRQELLKESYAVQSTAYALLAHLRLYYSLYQSVQTTRLEGLEMMRWINSMRNSIGGFSSTQDTLIALEALVEYTLTDISFGQFDLSLQIELSASPIWKRDVYWNKDNFTDLVEMFLEPVYGTTNSTAQGIGRVMMQLTTTVNVEYPWQLRETQDSIQFFELNAEDITFTGKNFSVMGMKVCVRWLHTAHSPESGLTVLEIDIPTSYGVTNDSLREYVRSREVSHLKHAEFYRRKLVYFFEKIDTSQTCVSVRATRWQPVANMTIQHRMKVFDYYAPGMHKTSMYTTYNLFNLNICDVCGSYQCSSCPYYNSTQNIPGFTTTDTVLPSSTSRQNISNIIKHVTTAKPVSRSTCLSSTIISLLTLITFLMHLV